MPPTLAAFVLLAAASAAASAAGVTLPPHPRLIVTPQLLAGVGANVAADPAAKAVLASITAAGTDLLHTPPVVEPSPGPSGILDTSRKVVGRMYTLGLLHLLDVAMPDGANTTWVARGAQEMAAVAAFTTWNPPHFLDVAEMAHGVAVGLDWLWTGLTPDDRALAASALARLGLTPGLAAYNASAWWWKANENWNQVCNGGLTAAALAVADDPQYAALASSVLDRAAAGLPYSVSQYAPDGAWSEGNMYIGYALKYLTMTLSVLRSTNTTGAFALPTAGVNASGLFLLHGTGPRGHYFRWSDCGPSPGLEQAANLMYLAHDSNVSVYSYAARAWLADVAANDSWGSAEFLLLFWSSAGTLADLRHFPADAVYHRRHVAYFRTEWEAPAAGGHVTPAANDTWVGLKGGDNTYSHGHLDQGGFVFTMGSYRWAVDLGEDSYALPGYFGSQRWSYYRLNTHGHNTLMFNNASQIPTAVSPIVAFNASTANDPTRFAVVDLSAAYANVTASVHRGVALVFPAGPTSTPQLVVADAINAAPRNASITWTMHTSAVVTAAAGRSATLAVPGVRTLTVRLLNADGCPGATFSWAPLELAPPQLSSRGISRLFVTVRAGPRPCTSLQVAMSTAPAADVGNFTVNPVTSWAQDGPLGSVRV